VAILSYDFWTQIEVVELAFPTWKKSALVPLRHIVVVPERIADHFENITETMVTIKTSR